MYPEARPSEVVPLYMSANGLGWFRLVPITAPEEIRALLDAHHVHIPDGIPPSLSIAANSALCAPTVAPQHKEWAGVRHPAKLTGLEILRRVHHALGHPHLDALLRTLAKSKKLRAGAITKADVAAFSKERCYLCDLTLQKRRTFKALTDHTVPELGKMWYLDTLTLRVPSAEHRFMYISLCSLKPTAL